MVGETISQDYVNAAANFGSNLGGGILSVLNTAGNIAGSTANNVAGAATSAVDQAGGYLSSLTNNTQQNQSQTPVIKNTVKNPTILSAASAQAVSNNPMNLDNLANGLSLINNPNVTNTLNGVNNALNTAGNSIVNSVASNGSNIVSNALSNTVDNSSNPLTQMIIGSLPSNINPTSMISPSIDATANLLTSLPAQQPNTMVIDASGKLVKYAGSGAQQLYNDIVGNSDNGNSISTTPDSGTMSSLAVTKSLKSMSSPVMSTNAYSSVNYTGDIIPDTDVNMSGLLQTGNLFDGSANLAVAKIPTGDGGYMIRWKPQENPDKMLSYPKEKASELFNKGDAYIATDIPDSVKYPSYTSGTTTVQQVPGQTQMLIKNTPISASENLLDIKSPITQSISSMLSQNTINNESAYSSSSGKKKDISGGSVFRHSIKTSPNIIIMNSLPRKVSRSKRNKKARVNKPVDKSMQFIYRKPNIAFTIQTETSVNNVGNNMKNINVMKAMDIKSPKIGYDVNIKRNNAIMPAFNINVNNMASIGKLKKKLSTIIL